MAWVYLIIAGILEIGFTSCLKFSEGFTKFSPTVLFIIFEVISFWLLNVALLTIPMGIAYAVWTGIGAAGTVIAGYLIFGEQLGVWHIFFLTTLVGSIVGLKVLC